MARAATMGEAENTAKARVTSRTHSEDVAAAEFVMNSAAVS